MNSNTKKMVRELCGGFSLMLLINCSSFASTDNVEHAGGPGFDCNKSTRPVEKLICSDSELSGIDGEMASVFAAKKKSVDDSQVSTLVKEQISWLSERCTACGIPEKGDATLESMQDTKICLKDKYMKRIEFLKATTLDKDQKNKAAIEILAERIKTAPFEAGTLPYTDALGFKMKEASFGQDTFQIISSRYKLQDPDISAIKAFMNENGARLYIEDLDHDGIKDLVLQKTEGTMSCSSYLFFHVNSDKSLKILPSPSTGEYETEGKICYDDALSFVEIAGKTYIAMVSNYIRNADENTPKSTIELFDLASATGRKGIGKIQINYSRKYEGNFIKKAEPKLSFIEGRLNEIADHFNTKKSEPLATSIMKKNEWVSASPDLEKQIIDFMKHANNYKTKPEAQNKKYIDAVFEDKARHVKVKFLDYEKIRSFAEVEGRHDILVEDKSRFLSFDIDNDGKNETVCYLVFNKQDPFTKKEFFYNRMVFARPEQDGTLLITDIYNKYEAILSYIDDSELADKTSYRSFGEADYFPVTNGKDIFIVKIGEAYRGWRRSENLLLAVYKLSGNDINLVDCMNVELTLSLKDVTKIK